jgi:hypothetical protein
MTRCRYGAAIWLGLALLPAAASLTHQGRSTRSAHVNIAPAATPVASSPRGPHVNLARRRTLQQQGANLGKSPIVPSQTAVLL